MLLQKAGDSQVRVTGKLPPQVTLEKESLLLNTSKLPEYLQSDPFVRLVLDEAKNKTVIRVSSGFKGGLRLLVYLGPELSHCVYHSLLMVEPGAEVTFTEEYAGPGLLNGHPPLVCGLTQVLAQAGANVNFNSVQNFGSSVQVFQRHLIQAYADSNVKVTPVYTGGAQTQLRSELDCLESGAQIDWEGAVRGDNKQRFDFWVSSRHEVPHTQARTQHWAVMADESQSVFNGNIVIGSKGLQTQASQQNKNMLLSPRATIHTFPKLEIATDEVQCAHGAAVVPVDEEQIYYLQSRGISRHEAQLMIIQGFTEPALRRLGNQELYHRSAAAISQKHSHEAEV